MPADRKPGSPRIYCPRHLESESLRAARCPLAVSVHRHLQQHFRASSSDKSGEVAERAMYALSQVARWPAGAKAILDANLMDNVAELLQSPCADVQRWTSQLEGNLAAHQSCGGDIGRESLPSAVLPSPVSVHHSLSCPRY